MKDEFPGYEKSLTELEGILQQLESGEVGIDKIAEMVKRASFLIEECRLKLRNIENELGETFENQN